MDLLNHNDVNVRLGELKKLKEQSPEPRGCAVVNNHIHTFYSFSPYSPSKALWLAYNAGLETAGIMDHDSVGGCREFLCGGDVLGMATTIGVECRADFSKTPLAGKSINNPDQKSIAYIAIHSIPHENIEKVAAFFAPLTEKRNERNRVMVQRLSAVTRISLDFDKDVAPLSKTNEGGSITERHILFALAKKIMSEADDVIGFLKGINIAVEGKAAEFLNSRENPFYEYDLLNVLKGNLVQKFYVDATDECPDIRDIVAFSKEIGAICAYAYLGDVGSSVTGDKKTQKFEDSYLPLLFETISDLGFDAVTYMPSRNTPEQLAVLREFTGMHSLMEISGEDINSPRQSFICEKLKDAAFANLREAAWELVRHERK